MHRHGDRNGWRAEVELPLAAMGHRLQEILATDRKELKALEEKLGTVIEPELDRLQDLLEKEVVPDLENLELRLRLGTGPEHRHGEDPGTTPIEFHDVIRIEREDVKQFKEAIRQWRKHWEQSRKRS